ncbi:MAG: hypothetical protein IH591_11295, partial [Bacteroidales bacterium]|nr:hypothetical protein [Bacteroidales bacterium]
IMLNPTAIHKNWDYRNFGDMFFVRKDDPLEIENKIDDQKYRNEIVTLRKYYDEFVQRIPSAGKDEVVMNK